MMMMIVFVVVLVGTTVVDCIVFVSVGFVKQRHAVGYDGGGCSCKVRYYRYGDSTTPLLVLFPDVTLADFLKFWIDIKVIRFPFSFFSFQIQSYVIL